MQVPQRFGMWTHSLLVGLATRGAAAGMAQLVTTTPQGASLALAAAAPGGSTLCCDAREVLAKNISRELHI